MTDPTAPLTETQKLELDRQLQARGINRGQLSDRLFTRLPERYRRVESIRGVINNWAQGNGRLPRTLRLEIEEVLGASLDELLNGAQLAAATRAFASASDHDERELSDEQNKTISLASDFHQLLLDGYHRAGREVGYWGRYFLRAVKKHGGVETAKRTLARKPGNKPQKGLQALIEAGRTDLSIESAVLRPEFRALFTADEIRAAQARLDAIPNFVPRRRVSGDEIQIEDIPDNIKYREGASKRVTVNAYERDSRARKACIARHGLKCAVCRMRFDKVYGEIGKGFIHVHHKRPLASVRQDYEIVPTRDLVPVCPNCHAMLHAYDPPLSVEELRRIYLANKNSKNRQ